MEQKKLEYRFEPNFSQMSDERLEKYHEIYLAQYKKHFKDGEFHKLRRYEHYYFVTMEERLMRRCDKFWHSIVNGQSHN